MVFGLCIGDRRNNAFTLREESRQLRATFSVLGLEPPEQRNGALSPAEEAEEPFLGANRGSVSGQASSCASSAPRSHLLGRSVLPGVSGRPVTETLVQPVSSLGPDKAGQGQQTVLNAWPGR